MRRHQFDPEHLRFRDVVRGFLDRHVAPNHERWRRERIIDREHLRRAAEHGLLGLAVPTALGGGGHDDYRFNQVVLEEYEHAGLGPCATGIMLQNDVVAPYLRMLADDAQAERWLRPLTTAARIGALGITEAGTGSDIAGVATTAVRDGAGYRVSGGKKYIGCGINADFLITVVRTGPERHRGLTLLVLEADMPGYRRVANLPRVGREPQDVAELAFHDVWVPDSHRLGEEGAAFGHLMHNLVRERLQIAVSAVAACRYLVDLTLDRVRGRTAFGRPLGSHQHVRFEMAEMATELSVARCYVDEAVRQFNAGTLTAAEAAEAKWWCSDLQVRTADRCFQLHGAAGYMDDSPMSRAWRDARVTTVYGGTNEIMKEIVGRSHGL